MFDVLAENPLLTLFIVIALGTIVGVIPFGALRFGASGALFVGLVLGAIDARLGEGLGLVQAIGLGLFVYTIGLSAGPSFFRDFRRNIWLLLGAVSLLGGYALLVVGVAKVIGVSPGLAGGLFAGTLSASPAVAAAQHALNDSVDPSVGFAVTYPVAIVLGMIGTSVALKLRLPAHNDPDRIGDQRIVTRTVELHQSIAVADVPGIAEIPNKAGGEVRISYHWRDGNMACARPDDLLRAGDRVLLVGTAQGVSRAAQSIGEEVDAHLAHDRRVVDFRRYLVSNPAIAGRTVTELRIPDRFDGLITRVRRGDQEFLATAQTRLQLGDRVRVVAPIARLDELTSLFGDSERRVTEVDFWTMGLGIALGVALGLVTISLGFAQLALGSAAGPLLIGLVLGRIDRSGPFVWTIPNAANLTIRQLGLMLFLATMGLSSGQAFVSRAFSVAGMKLGLASIAVLAVLLAAFWLLGRLVGHSTARVAGAMAGLVGQPAVLNHVNSVIDDDRAEAGYTALFALGFIAKIILVQVVVAL